MSRQARGGHFDEKVERVRTDYGLRIDCRRNGCDVACMDDGEVLPRGNHQPTVERVNGHVVTAVERTVTYSTWRDVHTRPGVTDRCDHEWAAEPRRLGEDVIREVCTKCREERVTGPVSAEQVAQAPGEVRQAESATEARVSEGEK